MKFLKQLFVPNRFDGTLLAVLFVFAFGYAFWLLDGWNAKSTYDHFYLYPLGWTDGRELLAYCLSPVLLITLACGAGLGWWSFDRWRWSLLTLSCLLCFFVPLAVSYLFGYPSDPANSVGVDQWWFMSAAYGGQVNGQPSFSTTETGLWIFGGTIALLLVSSGFIVLCRVIPAAVARVLGKSFEKFEISRTKILIGIAICMFLMATVNNVLVANGYNIYRDGFIRNYDSVEIGLGFIFGLVAFLLMIFWPSWALLRGEKSWNVIAGVATLAVPAIVLTILNEAHNYNDLPFLLVLCISLTVSLLFAATLSSLKQTDAPVKPSIWSALIFILIGFVAISPKFFDYSLFFKDQYLVSKGTSFQDRFSIALDSGKLLWKTNGQVRGYSGNYFANFTADENNSDVLSLVKSLNSISSLTLLDIHPGIETKLLSNSKLSSLSIYRGEITTSQLADLAAITQFNIFISNLKISNPDDKAAIKTNSQLTFMSESSDESYTDFLSAIEKFQSPQPLLIYSRITETEWQEITRLCQDSKIVLHHLPNNVSFDQVKSSSSNITFNVAWPIQLTESQVKFLFDSNANIDVQYVNIGQLFWDLVFGVSDRFQFSRFAWVGSQLKNEPDLQVLDDNHLVFGKNDQGEFTELFLPFGELSNAYENCSQLQRLSFDPMWLSSKIPVNTGGINNLSHLKSLTNLEELYFADRPIVTADMNFLQPLTNLKHLQIPSINRAKQGPVGFDVCQNLESITFFGSPDKITISELAKIPNLKKMTVVDSLYEGLGPKFEAMLETAIPNTKVEIIPAGTLFSDAPESFKQHLKIKRKEIRERLISESKD